MNQSSSHSGLKNVHHPARRIRSDGIGGVEASTDLSLGLFKQTKYRANVARSKFTLQGQSSALLIRAVRLAAHGPGLTALCHGELLLTSLSGGVLVS